MSKFVVSLAVFFLLLSLSSATDFIALAALANQRYGQSAQNIILKLQQTIDQLKNATELEKITGINDFFNTQIYYFDDDINIWGETDYWATPLEAIGKQRGDCEDFSIAKYIFLRELNIPNERLKLTYVRAQIGGPYSRVFVAHMILTYFETPSSEPLILDNLIPDIRTASRRIDLSPVFSFNSEGLWTGTSNTPLGKGSLANLSRWSNVLARIHADGIQL
jgi:predicted transglutaminase-like cysteine proteinase